MSKKKTFTLNDETKVNTYGFRVLNSGIDLSRFEANPVMLDQHYNSTSHVIGNWENLRIEGSLLLADATFDSEDEDAKKIEGKVNRGFLKGASIGISYNYEFMQRNPDDTYTLSQCELFEASIVAIPSNKNAVTLFADNGAPISTEDFKLSLSAIETKNPKINKQMEKINLTAVAIVALASVGVTSADDVASISKGIEMLNAKLTTANADLAQMKLDKVELEGKVTKQVEANAKAMLSAAKLEGRITAEDEATLLPQAIANYELTAMFVNKMPATKQLGATVNNSAAGAADAPKSIDEFEKLPLAKQLSFKTDNPEAYANFFAS